MTFFYLKYLIPFEHNRCCKYLKKKSQKEESPHFPSLSRSTSNLQSCSYICLPFLSAALFLMLFLQHTLTYYHCIYDPLAGMLCSQTDIFITYSFTFLIDYLYSEALSYFCLRFESFQAHPLLSIPLL